MSPDPIAAREVDERSGDALLRTLLDELPLVQLRVTGDCMSPALCPGDTALLVSPRRRRPRWGDIVLVRLAAGTRLHRLVPGWPSRRGTKRTKADRSAYWDPASEAAAVWGVVVGVERGGRALPRPARIVPALRSLAGALLRRVSHGARATFQPPATPERKPQQR